MNNDCMLDGQRIRMAWGRFTNQKDTAESPPEVEDRPTLDVFLMMSLSFKTGDKIPRKLHHGLRPLEFVLGRPKLNRIHGANAWKPFDEVQP